MKSAAQVEKEIGKQASDVLLKGLIVQGEGALTLAVDDPTLEARDELYGAPIAIERGAGCVRLPAGGRRYIRTALPMEEIAAAFEGAVLD